MYVLFSLQGIGNMSAEYLEVRQMISTLAKKLDCKGTITGHQIKNSLKSLNNFGSEWEMVLELVEALAKTISQHSDSTFDVSVR